tara:strand:+ start:177 stop:656 length:480 start_codon:yes stop_codon:yes gene_type:complete
VLGASAICEYSIADQGILHAGVSEQTALGVKTSVGVGIMSGVSTIDGNFTATTAGMYITGSTNAELSFNHTQTSVGLRARLGVSEIDSAFTKTSNGIMIGSGVASKDLNMTQSSEGDIKFVEVNASATAETYSTITPSGTESYTEITPSGTESWTEIEG